jgi:hypothetical protein
LTQTHILMKQITIFSLMIIISTVLFANTDTSTHTAQLLKAKAAQSIDLNQSDPINLKLGQTKRAIGLKRENKSLESTGIVKYRLDSTVAPGSYKELSERDAQGRETRYTLKLWSTLLNNWVIKEDDVTGYDQNGYANYSSTTLLNAKTNSYDVTKAEAVNNKLGNATSIKTYYFNNTTKEFEGVDRIDYTYAADDVKLLIETSYTWNSTTKNWEFANKTEVEYDSNGNLLDGSVYLMDDFTKTLYLDKKVSFEYDKNNNEIQAMVFSLSSITKKLEPNTKTEYVVNEKGAVLQETHYVSHYDSNTSTYSLITSNRLTYTYHTDGRLKSLLEENWDGPKELWVGVRKEINTFNEFDQNTNYVFNKWDTTTETWTPFYQNVFTYPSTTASAGYNTFNMYLWDTTNNIWLHRKDAISTRDENGNWTKYMMMSWRATTDVNGNPDGIWDGYVNFEFTHDLNFTSIQLLTFMSSNDHPNKILTMPSYKWLNGNWVKKDEAVYYYSQQVLSAISETHKDVSIIFPNPAKDFITVKTDGNIINNLIELYNLQGSKVLSTVLTNGNKVNIEQLAKGAYIFKVNAINGCFTGKLVKE